MRVPIRDEMPMPGRHRLSFFCGQSHTAAFRLHIWYYGFAAEISLLHRRYLLSHKHAEPSILIAGDAIITNDCLALDVSSGTSSSNQEKDQEIMDLLEAFLKDHPKVEVRCGHDVVGGNIMNQRFLQ